MSDCRNGPEKEPVISKHDVSIARSEFIERTNSEDTVETNASRHTHTESERHAMQ